MAHQVARMIQKSERQTAMPCRRTRNVSMYLGYQVLKSNTAWLRAVLTITYILAIIYKKQNVLSLKTTLPTLKLILKVVKH